MKKYKVDENPDYSQWPIKKQLAFDEEVMGIVDEKYYQKYKRFLERRNNMKGREYVDRFNDRIASTLLKDLGYDDDSKSRKFIKNLVVENMGT